VDEWRKGIAKEGGREGQVKLGWGPAGQSKVQRLETTCNDGAGKVPSGECDERANEWRRRRIAKEGGREGQVRVDWVPPSQSKARCGKPARSLSGGHLFEGSLIRGRRVQG
jgi:hypothetical protein